MKHFTILAAAQVAMTLAMPADAQCTPANCKITVQQGSGSNILKGCGLAQKSANWSTFFHRPMGKPLSIISQLTWECL